MALQKQRQQAAQVRHGERQRCAEANGTARLAGLAADALLHLFDFIEQAQRRFVIALAQGVTSNRRVERLSRRTPRRCSNSISLRLTNCLDSPSLSAAAVKLPDSMTWAKIRISSKGFIVIPGVDSQRFLLAIVV